MIYRNFVQSIFISGVLVALVAASARATEFTLDETQSKVALSGNVLSNKLEQQGEGSLQTTFYGSIVANVGSSNVQFTGGSVLTARTNGVWKPGPNGAAGSAPADYAAQAIFGTVKGALRNLVLDVTSLALPLSGTGQFDASGLVFSFRTNSNASFDYDAGALGKSGIALSGFSTNKIGSIGTLTSSGDVQLLSIQINAEFKFQAVTPNDSAVQLTGTLVATQSSAPRITSIEVKDQTVIMHVQGAGPAPTLDSSPDLSDWITRSPAVTPGNGDVVLTLPMGGPQEFYRVAK